MKKRSIWTSIVLFCVISTALPIVLLPQALATTLQDRLLAPAPGTSDSLPDLTLALRLDNQPSNCLPAALRGISADVSNIGTGAAGAFVVEVNGTRQNVAGLAAGQTLTLFFPNLGAIVNNGAVDVTDLVAESDESNNQTSSQLPTPTFAPNCTPTATSSIPTPTRPPVVTNTPTTCPTVTQIRLPWVEPVTSPTDQLSQEIMVVPLYSRNVTVTLETGTFFGVAEPGGSESVARVRVPLRANTTHHLTVFIFVPGQSSTTCGPRGPGSVWAFTIAQNGTPLTIVQQSSGSMTPTTAATSTPTATTPPRMCQVTYTVLSQWDTGFHTEMTIKNTSSTAINGWTLAWTFADGQTITQLWSGTYIQSGPNVSVTSMSWNAAIAPNSTVNLGFLAKWSGTNSRPMSFTLNGSPCSI